MREKQDLIFKNCSENRSIWGILAAPVVANSGKNMWFPSVNMYWIHFFPLCSIYNVKYVFNAFFPLYSIYNVKYVFNTFFPLYSIYNVKYVLDEKNHLFFQRKLFRILKTVHFFGLWWKNPSENEIAVAIGGRAATMLLHALCVFLCGPLFDVSWEPL